MIIFFIFKKKDLGIFLYSYQMLSDAIFLVPKNAANFVCEKCHFKCSKQSNYNKHLLTLKDKKLFNAMKKLYI